MKIKKVYESMKVEDRFIIIRENTVIHNGGFKKFFNFFNLINNHYTEDSKQSIKYYKVEELSEDDIQLLIDTNNFNL